MMLLKCVYPAMLGMGNSHLPAISTNCIAISINIQLYGTISLHAFQHRLHALLSEIRVDLADLACLG
jgi:hypothetical protein